MRRSRSGRPDAETAGSDVLDDVAARRSSPVLVGRAAELAVLARALERAQAGSPATVLLAGEAGVGKSRVLSDFAAQARWSGARVLVGGCLDLGGEGLPFAPFAEMLRSLVRDLGTDGVAALLPSAATGEFARLLPEFGAADISTDTAMARARLFEQMLTLLERLAEAGPVVLVVEDAHWADRSTRDLISFLVGREQLLSAVLIIVSYRSDELHRTHPLRPLLAELSRLGWVERLELERLGRPHVDELIARITGSEPWQAVADRVYERTDGNPLFIEELLCCNSSRDGGMGLELPESLRDLLLASVRRLPEPTQELLRAASAGGQRTRHAVLAAVTGLADNDLDRALRPAISANVLAVDRDEYTFRHELISEAIYDDLMPGERTRLHTRFAEVLSADSGLVTGGRGLIEQAHHWYYAHDMAGALASAWRAAAEAAHILAHAEQLNLLARVLELWDKVPDASQRIGASHLTVLERAVAAAQNLENYERGEAFASAALKELDWSAEPGRAALLLEARARLNKHVRATDSGPDLRAALELVPPGVDDGARARVLVSVAHSEPHGRQAEAAAEEALTLARQANDVATQVRALAQLAAIESDAGNEAAALRRFAQARALAGQPNSFRPLLTVAINESHVLEGMGMHEQAAQVAKDGIASAHEHGLARSTGTFLAINVAEPLIALGCWDEAIEVIETAMALSPPELNRMALRLLTCAVALRRGDLASARAMIAAAKAAFGQTQQAISKQTQYLSPLATLEADLHVADGSPAEALDVITAAMAEHDLVRDPRYAWPLVTTGAAVCAAVQEAVSDRTIADRAVDILSQLRTLAGKLNAGGLVLQAWQLTFLATAGSAEGSEPATQALASWDAAAAAWENLRQPYEVATAMLRAAEAALAEGDRAGAAWRLRKTGELADQLGAAPVRDKISALARSSRIALGTSRDAGRHGTHGLGLTARDFEVLRLVAAGRSNPEIGAELFISAKTASVHVSNILGKLGVSGRGEAAAAAHRLGLFEPTSAA